MTCRRVILDLENCSVSSVSAVPPLMEAENEGEKVVDMLTPGSKDGELMVPIIELPDGKPNLDFAPRDS